MNTILTTILVPENGRRVAALSTNMTVGFEEAKRSHSAVVEPLADVVAVHDQGDIHMIVTRNVLTGEKKFSILSQCRTLSKYYEVLITVHRGDLEVCCYKGRHEWDGSWAMNTGRQHDCYSRVRMTTEVIASAYYRLSVFTPLVRRG